MQAGDEFLSPVFLAKPKVLMILWVSKLKLAKFEDLFMKIVTVYII